MYDCYFQTKVLEGGLVPKNLYLTEGELVKEGGHMTDDTIYHSVSLSKGQVSLYLFPAQVKSYSSY